MSFWTEAKDARLRELWDSGDTAEQIALSLGAASKNAIIGRAHRLGLRSRKGLRTQQRSQKGLETPRRSRIPHRSAGVSKVSAGAAVSCEPAPLEDVKAPKLSLVQAADSAPEGEGLKTLWERGPRECCWPVGRPDPKRGQLYCAQATERGRSYCPAHTTAQPGALRQVKLRDETVRAARPGRRDDYVDLTELFG